MEFFDSKIHSKCLLIQCRIGSKRQNKTINSNKFRILLFIWLYALEGLLFSYETICLWVSFCVCLIFCVLEFVHMYVVYLRTYIHSLMCVLKHVYVCVCVCVCVCNVMFMQRIWFIFIHESFANLGCETFHYLNLECNEKNR